MHVAKGKKRASFAGGDPDDEQVAQLLGPTGNLRAPTLEVGRTVVVGFDQELYEEVFGGC